MTRAFRPIVVGTDFSRQGALAVRRAAQLALQHGAELHLVHAYEPLSARAWAMLGLKRDAGAAFQAAARERLEAAALEVREGGVRVHCHLAKGAPITAIEVVAKRLGAELVIVGALGERSLRNTAFGTTSERLLEALPRDVLTVRRASGRPHARVLVAVDGGSDSPAIVTAARRLCPDARMWALHVFEPRYERMLRSAGASDASVRRHIRESGVEAKARVSEVLRGLGLSQREVGAVVRRGYPPHVIAKAIERYGVDLVVLGRARTWFSELLLGSVSKQVLRTATCDVAVVGRSGS